jgi:glycerol-3-phosphate acyltransferase PlsY
MLTYALPAFAYLLGSISSAIVIARVFRLQDPRQVGSGNPGATNILRYGGKLAAALTLVGDVLKGVIPVVVARVLEADAVVLALTMLAAFLGHLFPVFHGFKGGKGVATALGVLVALSPAVGGLCALTWLVMAVVFRYSSLAAIVASAAAPAYVYWLVGGGAVWLASFVMALILLARHHGNIRRLLAGTEGRIGQK